MPAVVSEVTWSPTTCSPCSTHTPYDVLCAGATQPASTCAPSVDRFVLPLVVMTRESTPRRFFYSRLPLFPLTVYSFATTFQRLYDRGRCRTGRPAR